MFVIVCWIIAVSWGSLAVSREIGVSKSSDCSISLHTLSDEVGIGITSKFRSPRVGSLSGLVRRFPFVLAGLHRQWIQYIHTYAID